MVSDEHHLVDELINELIDCGQIEPEPVHVLPNLATYQHDLEPKIPATIPEIPTAPITVNSAKSATYTPAANTSHTYTSKLAPRSPILMALNPMRRGRSVSFDSGRSIDLTRHSSIADLLVPMSHTQGSLFNQYYNWLLALPLEHYSQRLFPFFLGMAFMYVLHSMESTLWYCGGVVAQAAKIIAFYGPIVLGVLWFAGVVKKDTFTEWPAAKYRFFTTRGPNEDVPVVPMVSTSPRMEALERVLVSPIQIIPGGQESPRAQVSPIAQAAQVSPTAKVATMRMSPKVSPIAIRSEELPTRERKVQPRAYSEEPMGSPIIHPRECEVAPFPPFHHSPPGVKERPRVQRVGTDTREQSRKSRQVHTYLSEERRHSSASLPGREVYRDAYRDAYRDRSRDDPYRDRLRDDRYRDSIRVRDDPYKDVRDLYRDQRDYRDYRDNRDLKGAKYRDPRVPKFYKPLPPVIKMPNKEINHEADLPLVHEVKLKNLDQEPQYDLDRLGTVLSKKSVLGTRANYLRFLSNVEN